jgi:hypothetical protein
MERDNGEASAREQPLGTAFPKGFAGVLQQFYDFGGLQ